MSAELETITSFVSKELRRLQAFRRWWLENNIHDPQAFPFSLQSGDWDEQLRLFDEEWEKKMERKKENSCSPK